MRLKNFRALLLALLFMMLIPLASAAPATTSIDTNSISIEEATNVADFYKEEISGSITGYADWKGAIVQKATTYYDLNGKVSAYSFDAFVKNQYAGYLIISATRDNYSLLEFSKGKTPDSELSTRTESRKLALVDANSQQMTLGEGRPLYLGATFYYMEYPVETTSSIKSTSQQDRDRILVDLYEKKIIGPEMITVPTGRATTAEQNSLQNEADTIFNEESIREFNTQKKKEAQKEWNMIEKGGILKSQDIESSISKSYISEKTIRDVPNFGWLNGCSPTSAAMVVGYWRDLGLTRLPNDDELTDGKPCGDPLNTILATEMGTESNGETWPWMIAYGINRVVAVGSGYDYTSGSELVTAYSWPNIQNEIDSERPFVLSMLWAGEPIYAFGHSVAAVGYGYDSLNSLKYVQIHDTWDNTTEPYIRFGNWVGAMNSYMRPDYTYTITSSAGTHGGISPSGMVQVPTGTQQTYSITPDSGYVIDELLVDGSAIEASNDYIFSDVTKDQTISATFRQQTPPGNYWLEEVVDAYNGPNGLPSYNKEILGSDLHMYTTLGTDGWILCAFSDQLDFEDVSTCTIYEYSSYIGVSQLPIDPNDYIYPEYCEWNIGTGYETYLITFTRPNLINISIPGFHGGNILGARCTVPGAKGEGVVKSVSPAIIEILGNRTSAR